MNVDEAKKSETAKPVKGSRGGGLVGVASDRHLRQRPIKHMRRDASSAWGGPNSESASNLNFILNPTPSQVIAKRKERAFNDGSSMMSHSFFTVGPDKENDANKSEVMSQSISIYNQTGGFKKAPFTVKNSSPSSRNPYRNATSRRRIFDSNLLNQN